ncbi:Cryptochrome-1 [Dactylellina cionopaga]|nr:Cryptochrome-1 [Dactylellina cionopaga]
MASSSENKQKILIYIVRRELRLTDNPVLHHISETLSKGQTRFTHLLPVYVFPARQIEIGGFLSKDLDKTTKIENGTSKSPTPVESPYPPARSVVGGFPRCGPHRAKFWAESVWDFKISLESVGSGLVIRVGRIDDVLEGILNEFKKGQTTGNIKREVVGVWITAEEGVAEKTDERNVFRVAGMKGVDVRIWKDEKFLVDDRDLPYVTPKDIPDKFSEFKKTVGSPRDAPRKTLPRPSNLPPLPTYIPPQLAPFKVPNTLSDWISGLLKPLYDDPVTVNIPKWPLGAKSQHTFHGGEAYALEHLHHLVSSGAMTAYQDTRHGFVGNDHGTKLAAWLALGCITSRQVHEYLIDFEEGKTSPGQYSDGYSDGENKGTAGVRAELLWRDYLRLCTRKYGCKLFRLEGFKGDHDRAWKHGDDPEVNQQIQKFIEGKTGVPLIDASLREMYFTGYTSDRGRHIVAKYFGRKLGIDWRIGAEWFEYCLVDYDVSGNWGNWQYCAGVSNDPSWDVSPIKQGLGSDVQEEYTRTWLDESNGLVRRSNDLEL